MTQNLLNLFAPTVLMLTMLISAATLLQFQPTKKPIVIAHRGASGYLPEHTEGAKVLAIAQGADYVEQDVVLTKDRVPVVIHDICLDQVTNVAEVYPDRKRNDGKFYVIDFDWQELQVLTLNERAQNSATGKGQRFPGGFGQKIMRLEDEVKLIQGLNRTLGLDVGIYVELKQPAFHQQETGQSMGGLVASVLQKYGYTSSACKCYLQCFEAAELQQLKQSGCPLKRIQLLDGLPNGETEATKVMTKIARYAQGVGPSISAIVQVNELGQVHTNGFVEAAHAAGLQVHPYTIRADRLPAWAKDVKLLHRVLFQQLKVDGAFTDFPDLTRKALDQM